jgi:hypothetical protein
VKKKSGGLFACCFAPSVADDHVDVGRDFLGPSDGGSSSASGGGAKKAAPAFGSGGKATSFKVGKMDIGKVCTRTCSEPVTGRACY